jgi:hypothetical protein
MPVRSWASTLASVTIIDRTASAYVSLGVLHPLVWYVCLSSPAEQSGETNFDPSCIVTVAMFLICICALSIDEKPEIFLHSVDLTCELLPEPFVSRLRT